MHGSKLTLGYGNGGAAPWEFVFAENRDKDVGFFRLFLSSSPADFACLTRRRSPFERVQEKEQDPGNRHGAELDEEAREARELEAKLESKAGSWGVKMATVKQIKKARS